MKRYARGLVHRKETFRPKADLAMQDCAIMGAVGPNGSEKTSLFELMTGWKLRP